MRIRLGCLCFLLWVCCSVEIHAAAPRIDKVLTFFLDEDGRQSLSPSLYERDAYQALLRAAPGRCSAMRFDVHWRAKGAHGEPLLLRLELRSSGRDLFDPVVLESHVRARRVFSSWTSLRLEGDAYREFGQLTAWRASLWRGDQLLAEQKSFLW